MKRAVLFFGLILTCQILANAEKILLTLQGQPENMNASQLFNSTGQRDEWLGTNSLLLPNYIIRNDSLLFDGGFGIFETKPDTFTNLPEAE